MDYDKQEIIFGDIPPGLEDLGKLPERVTRTISALGQKAIVDVYSNETTASFNSDSAIYAA